MKTKNRTQLEILKQSLETFRNNNGKLAPTKFAVKARISTGQKHRVIKYLIDKNAIEVVKGRRERILYQMTDDGYKFAHDVLQKGVSNIN